MDFGSEKNDWGQNLWWGLHLISPAYLRWDDWKIRVYEPYDNELKFLNEARDWQSWYFAFRGVLEGDRTAYLKYVLFRLLNKENQEKFKIWEWRYGITKIDPEPGEKCIYRDDFLNFIKEQMVIRYHEIMSEPPERDFEADQVVLDARGQIKRVIQGLFKDNLYKLRVLGMVLPEVEDRQEFYHYLAFNPNREESFKMVFDFLPGEFNNAQDLHLHEVIEKKMGKPVFLIPLCDFKDRETLDLQLIFLRKGPERWDVNNPLTLNDLEKEY